MKLVQFSLVFFTAAFALLAHPGHGFADSGLAHYLTSAIHVAPAIFGALFLVVFSAKRSQRDN